MRILLDYRPALRTPTGVGEYVHQLARALAAGPDDLTLFSASWKDRPTHQAMREIGRARLVDQRLPVRWLNFAWHRLGWPPIEPLTGLEFDVVHSPHPLLIPARRAAQVVTIHDLDFLAHPEWVSAEVRRDYPGLARRHAHRAGAVIVPSQYTARQVVDRLGVPSGRVFVCPHGVRPGWSAPGETARQGAHILFIGTLAPRKNVGGLLEAYLRLRDQLPGAPPLKLAGAAGPDAAEWLARMATPPLAGVVEHVGYVDEAKRRILYQQARLVVLPSFDEGFGLPVLEAMALGIPVVASDRGAIPEVAGDAAILVNPDDPQAVAEAMRRVLTDEELACRLAEAGRRRAREFTWERSAALVRDAYRAAMAR